MDDQQRTAIHEAGHASMATAFGWLPGTVTVTAGSQWAGCCGFRPVPLDRDALALLDVTLPFAMWPSAITKHLTGDVFVAMSGEISELLLQLAAAGRQPDSVAERATELLGDLPAIADADRAWAVSIVDDPVLISDAEKVSKSLWVMFGPDRASTNSFLDFAEAQVRCFVASHASEIMRLADVALLAGSLSGAAVARLLDGDRDR